MKAICLLHHCRTVTVAPSHGPAVTASDGTDTVTRAVALLELMGPRTRRWVTMGVPVPVTPSRWCIMRLGVMMAPGSIRLATAPVHRRTPARMVAWERAAVRGWRSCEGWAAPARAGPDSEKRSRGLGGARARRRRASRRLFISLTLSLSLGHAERRAPPLRGGVYSRADEIRGRGGGGAP
jgi:hypothetical protein